MKLEFIEIEKISDHVRKVYLNRPEKRNALCNPLRQELFNSLEELDKDPEVKTIIIAGKGSCFCAGYDLSYNNKEDLPFHKNLYLQLQEQFRYQNNIFFYLLNSYLSI